MRTVIVPFPLLVLLDLLPRKYLTSRLLKYVKRQAQELMEEKDGWERLIELLDELIEIADSCLAASIINKLYKSGA